MPDRPEEPRNERQPACAILGAAGFLGSALSRTLADRGWRVVPIHRATGDLRAADLDARGSYGWRGDTSSLTGLLQSARPDVVVNLSARYVAEHTAADVDDLIDDNITRPAHVLEALRISGIRPR
jgi:nucleoside-diphosphate-sugar epimerase